MRKVNLLVIMLTIFAISTIAFVGCGKTETLSDENGISNPIIYDQFVVIETRFSILPNTMKESATYIMYDKDSKVMYCGYPCGDGWFHFIMKMVVFESTIRINKYTS